MMKNIWMDIAFPIVLLIIFVIAIFSLVGLTKSINNPPKLTITGSTTVSTTEDQVVISGTTVPGAKVKVNTATVPVDVSGNFSYTASPETGVNYYNVSATRNNVISNTQTVKVTKTEAAPVAQSTTENSSATSSSSASSTATTSDNTQLSTSGPADSAVGAFGLTAILASLYFYFKSRKNNKATTYKLFT